MVRVAWPLFAAGLVILGVHHMPWPVRSQSQETYRANASPAVTVATALAANAQICATEDPAPPAPKVQTKSQAPEPAPLPPPPSDYYDPSDFNPQYPARATPPLGPIDPPPSAQPETPSAGLPTWKDAVEKVEKKLIDSFKATSQYTAQPPVITDVPTPPSPPGPIAGPLPVPPPSPFSVPVAQPASPPIPTPFPEPVAPSVGKQPRAHDPGKHVGQPSPKPVQTPLYPDPTAEAPRGPTAVIPPPTHVNSEPTEKPITSPWTFHLEIVNGKNVITAKVGKTVQFRVNCDKVDIQSPHGTIQASGNVKVSSLGLEVLGEKMTIQLQEDSMVLEGKAQMKCQRDGQEIDLRSERFTLRLSEIQGQTSVPHTPAPQTLAPTSRGGTTTQSSTSQSPRPPIVDVSRDFP